MLEYVPSGMGWHRDLPDPRDFTPWHEETIRLLDALKPAGNHPEVVDWREFCGQPRDQQSLSSGPVHACMELLRYFERKSSGRILEPSRLFVYHVARRLECWQGDSGTSLRVTLKAIARFGVPPERLWPYDCAQIDVEPSALVFASARKFPRLRYVRLDPRRSRGRRTLELVKSFLVAGFACVCGFPVTTGLTCEADIAYPTVFDDVRGGQAMLVLGYDDQHRVRSDRGALLVRSSWGANWGEGGFGWLPYAYVLEQLAVDFWTLLEPGWLASAEFYRPVI